MVTSIRRVLPERLGSIGFTFLSLLWLLIPIACRLFGTGRVRMEDTINFSAFKLGECESFLSWNSLNRKLGSNLMRKTCKTFFFFFSFPPFIYFFSPDYFYHECLQKCKKLRVVTLVELEHCKEVFC